MIKKIAAVVITASLLLIFISPVKAAESDMGVELSVFPSVITINTTETKYVELNITNNQDVEDSFSLTVWPHSEWAGITPNLEKYKISKLSAGETATSKLYFSVAAGADEIITTFLVSVNSITNPEVSLSEDVIIRVVRKTEIYISKLILDKYYLSEQGECIEITTTISNFGLESGPYRLQTSIKKGPLTIEQFEDYIEKVPAKSTEDVTNRYCFDKYAIATTYYIESNLRTGLNKFVDIRTTSLIINEKPNLVYKKSVTYTPFAQKKTIKVRNEGNIVEENFYVSEAVSDFISKFFYPEQDPVVSEIVDGKVTYKWLIHSLEPGEETEIKFEIRFFSIWFSGLILIILVFFAFTNVYRPKIKKNVTFIGPLKRGKEISVLLEIRNSTIDEIKNITVNDTIPSIAQIVERFDTIKPAISKAETGTALTWKIKSLQPLEERVLTYRIKPVVDIIGSMRLPSAIMSYLNKRKQKKSISSKSVEIK